MEQTTTKFYTLLNCRTINDNFFLKYFVKGKYFLKLFILIFLVQISLLHSQQPNPPTLNSPANLEIFNRNSTSSITWSWSRVTGALEYQLKNYWVGSDYTAISVNGSTTSYTDNNVSTWQIPHEFEWKVRVRTSGGWSNWSTPRRYYLDVTPSAPSLSSPPDNSTYYFGQNATFSYNPPSGVTNVSEYMIKFTQTGSADKPITSGSNNYKSITFPDVLGLGDWNWSVKIMKSYPSGYDYTKYATKIGWSPFPASRKLTLKYPSPNLFMNQSLRITTTRTDVSTIYSIPTPLRLPTMPIRSRPPLRSTLSRSARSRVHLSTSPS